MAGVVESVFQHQLPGVNHLNMQHYKKQTIGLPWCAKTLPGYSMQIFFR